MPASTAPGGHGSRRVPRRASRGHPGRSGPVDQRSFIEAPLDARDQRLCAWQQVVQEPTRRLRVRWTRRHRRGRAPPARRWLRGASAGVCRLWPWPGLPDASAPHDGSHAVDEVDSRRCERSERSVVARSPSVSCQWACKDFASSLVRRSRGQLTLPAVYKFRMPTTPPELGRASGFAGT